MPAQFTLFHDGQFWRGLYETSDQRGLYATTIIFGSEPTNAEFYEWFIAHGSELIRQVYRTQPVPGQVTTPTRGNPKRLRRAINKQQHKPTSSKAHEALKLTFELEKAQHKKIKSQHRRAHKEYTRAVRAKKKKDKHRGK